MENDNEDVDIEVIEKHEEVVREMEGVLKEETSL
jgi:hypothetical protein